MVHKKEAVTGVDVGLAPRKHSQDIETFNGATETYARLSSILAYRTGVLTEF